MANYYYVKNSIKPIPIGFEGENDARTIVFDISRWIEDYGNGTALLVHQRPGDAEPYPCATEQKAGTIEWAVQHADLVTGGYGRAQISYKVGDNIVARSPIYKTVACASISAVEAGEPGQDWINDVLDAAAQAETSATNAANSAETAKQAETAATQAATSAAADANAAAQSEANASKSASAAAGSAETAQTAATTATDAAGQAQASQTAAAGSASVAAESATQAAGSQTAAKNSEDAAAASAATATEAAQDVLKDFDEINEEVADLTLSIFDINDVGCSVTQLEGFTYIAAAPIPNTVGTYIGIKLGTNPNYDTYYKVLTKDTEIWFKDTQSPYVSLCIGQNYSGTATDSVGNEYLLSENPVRYRKLESNLPTDENKISVNKGDAIALTVTKGGTDVVYGLKTEKIVKESFKNQIVGDQRECCIKYGAVDTDIGSAGKEQVSIYIPVTVGYIKYAFIRNEVSGSNTNNWRIDRAYACDTEKNVRFPITAQGEWEMALKINGRLDFIGGYAHGDEVLKSISFFVDGEKIDDISAIVNDIPFNELRIVEFTDLYDPNDGATLATKDNFTPVANHGREYIITKEGVRLKQFAKFNVSEIMTTSYMTMFPIIRGRDLEYSAQITDTYYSDDTYEISDVSTVDTGATAYNWRKDCTRGVIWSNVSGVSAQVEILKQKEDGILGEKYHKVQSTAKYNKFYWTVCCIGNQTTEIELGHRFETDAMYKINVCK